MATSTRRPLAALALLLSSGCGDEPAPPPPSAHADGTGWIFEGTEDERWERLARQLRGFDVAMVEVGHRYVELAWAGRDENWGYAQYQLEKIRTAITNGLERRPRRAGSAPMIDAPLAAVERAVAARSRADFDAALESLTQSCNACHVAERVPFVTIAPPTVRVSPVRGAAEESP